LRAHKLLILQHKTKETLRSTRGWRHPLKATFQLNCE